MRNCYHDFDNLCSVLSKNGIKLNDIPNQIKENATDIHLSSFNPVTIYTYSGHYNTEVYLNKKQISDFISAICGHSLYKHSEEIKNGFIVLENGYRCGICGTGVMKSNELSYIKDISSVNIRLSRFIKDVSKKIIEACKDKLLYGVLIVGEPSSGKTTVLKDIIYQLKSFRVSVLDERYELCNNNNCDTLLGINKKQGFKQLIRTMSPQIIICDELDEGDIDAVNYAASTGVSVIASAHGVVSNKLLRPALKELLKTGAFNTVVELGSRNVPGQINRIYSLEEINEIHRIFDDHVLRNDDSA